MLTKLLTDTLYVVLPKVLPLSVLFLALAPAGGGGGKLALIFSGYVPLASQTPYPIVRWPIIDPILVTFGQIFNFRDPNLVTFCFYELTHFLD